MSLSLSFSFPLSCAWGGSWVHRLLAWLVAWLPGLLTNGLCTCPAGSGTCNKQANKLKHQNHMGRLWYWTGETYAHKKHKLQHTTTKQTDKQRHKQRHKQSSRPGPLPETAQKVMMFKLLSLLITSSRPGRTSARPIREKPKQPGNQASNRATKRPSNPATNQPTN